MLNLSTISIEPMILSSPVVGGQQRIRCQEFAKAVAIANAILSLMGVVALIFIVSFPLFFGAPAFLTLLIITAASLVISLCVLLSKICCFFSRKLSFQQQSTLPQSFLRVLQKEYCSTIRDLVVSEKLSLRELRLVLSVWFSKEFAILPSSIQDKLNHFGVERLREGVGNQIKDLDSVLQSNCPFYFIKEFVDLGDECLLPRGTSLDGAYWLNCLRSSVELLPRLFFQTVSQENFGLLVSYIQNHKWDQVSKILPTICFFIDIELDNIAHLYPKEDIVRAKALLKTETWVAKLCKQGINWAQVKVLNNLSASEAVVLENLFKAEDGCFIQQLYHHMLPHLENDASLSHLSVFTFEELREWVRDSGSLNDVCKKMRLVFRMNNGEKVRESF